MSFYSQQKWFCNCCGREMHSPPPGAFGRRYRCCSADCVKEMNWRETLSILGKPYEPQPQESMVERL